MMKIGDVYMNIGKSKKFISIFEIMMAVLSLVIFFIVVIELSYNLPQDTLYIFNIIDNSILIIFTIDYFTRLFFSKDKKEFFKHNIIDLISIIPFNSIFQATRLVRLAKLLKVIRSVIFLLKFRNHIEKFLKTNNFNYIIWITLCTLLVGTVGIHFAEGTTFGNALWWSFVTITTVGYGDISPVTPLGRILAGFLMLVGIGFLSMLTGTIATFFLRKTNSTNYKNETIEDIKSKLDNFNELSIEDIDNIHKVLKALKS